MNKKVVGIILCAVIIVVAAYAVFYFNGEDLDFIEKVKSEVISANVLLIRVSEDVASTTYSTGHSGAIFKYDSGRYYVLTALHAIELNHSKIIVLKYDQPMYNQSDVLMGIANYYSQFPEATVEYFDEAYDLAVLSFISNDEYKVLTIASEPPEYNELVAAVGNPHEHNRNSVTTGKITSKSPVPFGDELGKSQHNVITHSAKISSGSSGGALLNKKLEIVGINLGGSENIFRGFIRGKAMPSDKILLFLKGME